MGRRGGWLDGPRMVCEGVLMRRLVTEGWTRTALLSCAVLLLSIVGAASQALAPRAIAAHLNGALVDGSRASDHGIRNGQAGPRVAIDRRQIEPGFDRVPPPDILAPVRLIEPVPAAFVRVAWADTHADFSSSHRVAHRPRGPPQAGPTSHELWNGGADRPHGEPSRMMG
jgi:hypothetical protein